jgi:hypothetical protein
VPPQAVVRSVVALRWGVALRSAVALSVEKQQAGAQPLVGEAGRPRAAAPRQPVK